MLSRGKVSRAPGGGGAQAGSGGTVQSGSTLQQADLLSALCAPRQPQQVAGKLQVGKYAGSFMTHPESLCTEHPSADMLGKCT